MLIAKSSHFFNSTLLLLFFMLGKVFAFKVVDTCTNKASKPIAATNVQWTSDEFGTNQFSVDLTGLVQAVGALRITKPDRAKSDIPNSWYVYWDQPNWVNGYSNSMFDPTIKVPPRWVGDDPYTYTNSYNVINVPLAEPVGINMDLYTDCVADANTKELSCLRCQVFLQAKAPAAAAAPTKNEDGDHSESWLDRIFKSQA